MTIVIVIVFFLYISELSISFKPFSIQLPYWYRGLAIFLVAVGISVYSIGERVKGYSEGLENGYKMVIEKLKEKE